MNVSDAYRLLDVDPAADDSGLKRAYRKAMRRTHPDSGGNAEQFTAVKDAYELIIEQRSRPTPASLNVNGVSVDRPAPAARQHRQQAATPAQVIGEHKHTRLAHQFSFGETFEIGFFGNFSSTKKNQALAEDFVHTSLTNRIPRSLPAARLFNGVSLGRGKRLPHLLVSGYRAVILSPVLVPDQRYRHQLGELIGTNQQRLVSTDVAELRKDFEKQFPALNTIAITVAMTSALDSYRPTVTASEKTDGQELVSAANVGTAIADATLFLGAGSQHYVVDTDVLTKVSALLS